MVNRNKKITNDVDIYVLTESHMEKLEEMISALQNFYCDVYANRGISVSAGYDHTPISQLCNALAENNLQMTDVLTE